MSARCRTRRCPTAAARPASTAPSAPSPSRSRCPRRCSSTASAASRARAAPASPTRSPATPTSSWSTAAPTSRSPIASDGPAVQLLLLRQHRADLPGRRAHRYGVPVPLASLRPRVDADRLRALRVRVRAAHRHAPRHRSCAGWPVTTPRSTRSGTATRAAGRSSTPRWATASRSRWSATSDGDLVEASWPEALDLAARGLAAARAGRGIGVLSRWPLDARGRLRLRASSRAPCSAPTTSTSAPARTLPEETDVPGRLRRRPRRRRRRDPHLRRPRRRASRAPRRARARGGVADHLPAAAQGGARASHSLVVSGPWSRTRGLDQDGRPPARLAGLAPRRPSWTRWPPAAGLDETGDRGGRAAAPARRRRPRR